MSKIWVICEKCRRNFSMLSNVDYRNVKLNGESLTLTVLTCPSCGCEMTVQIDDETSSGLLHYHLELLQKAAIDELYNKGKIRDYRKVDIVNKEIHRLRKELAEKFNGSEYHYNGEGKTLNFSRANTKII